MVIVNIFIMMGLVGKGEYAFYTVILSTGIAILSTVSVGRWGSVKKSKLCV